MTKFNLSVDVAFNVETVRIALQTAIIALSADKALLADKNIKARLEVCKLYAKANTTSLQFIVDNSSKDSLMSLMNYSNYKTAERILHCSNMLCNAGKYSTILDYTMTSLKKLSANDDKQVVYASVAAIMTDSKQCYSRISNAIKALQFFNVIEVKNCTFKEFNKIDKMNSDTVCVLTRK